jgi:hypothetical protein
MIGIVTKGALQDQFSFEIAVKINAAAAAIHFLKKQRGGFSSPPLFCFMIAD